MVSITSADNGTSSPVVVLMWIITASICLYSNLSPPKVDKMLSSICGCNANSCTNFSSRKDRFDPLSNSKLA